MNYTKKFNTIINLCRKNQKVVLERFGKIHSVKDRGLFFSVPLVDKLKVVKTEPYRFDFEKKGLKTKDKAEVNLKFHNSVLPDDLSELTKKQFKVSDIKNNQTVNNVIKNVVSSKEFKQLLHHDDNTEEKLQEILGSVYKNIGYNLYNFQINDVIVKKSGENVITNGSRGADPVKKFTIYQKV